MSDMTERKCNKCIHHTSGNCDSWDCKMQTVEDVKKEAVNKYVKAVVEELEERKEEREKQYKTASMEDGSYMLSKCFSEGARAYGNAIEIVKQGGVSDDVCEWKSESDGELIRNPHTNGLFSNEQSMQNVYCNTCRKKIKVVVE